MNVLQNETEMNVFSEEFSRKLTGGEVIFLNGDLGAGKTTFTRGLLKGLGYEGRVKSPTFTIMEPYELKDRHLYHYDLYRIADPSELEYLGLRDQLNGSDILVVEWPDRAGGLLKPDINISIEIGQNQSRRIDVILA